MHKLLKVSAIMLLIPITAFAASLNVQIEQGPIRSTPSFFGKIIAKVRYGEPVELIKEQGSWRMVKAGKKTGWIHQSAVSESQVELVAGKSVDSHASGKEIALAGKGFNAEVEKAYKAKHREISFAWVDAMEKITVKNADIAQFIKQGGLREDEL